MVYLYFILGGICMVYVMTDIHGDFYHFYQMLVLINFSRSDKLFILGDVLDKGEENLCLLDFIRGTSNIYLLKGNHELCCENYLRGKISRRLWDIYGGINTRVEVDQLPDEKKRELAEYLSSLPIWEKVVIHGQEYLLTHSGYCNSFKVVKDGKIDIESSIKKAVESNEEKYLISHDIHTLRHGERLDKLVIVGHFPTIFLKESQSNQIYFSKNYINLDTGNGHREIGGRLACLRLEDNKAFYV